MKLKLVPGGGDTPIDCAAEWAVRMDRDDLGDAERAAFESWLDEPGNDDAFGRANDAMGLFDGLDAELPELAALRAEALAHPVAPGRRWMPWAGGAIAASIAAALLIAIQPSQIGERSPDAPARIADAGEKAASPAAAAGTRYATAIGQQRVVALADGSKVTLNTGTEITVDYRPGERIVRLVRGQALFDVAHAADRPFSVIVADRKVTALGTLFEVRMDKDKLRVTLLRGRVRIDSQPTAATPLTLPAPTFLDPGEQFSAVGHQAPAVHSVDVAQQLLWRRSLVEFNDEPIGDAIAELNRYSVTPIIVTDDRVASMRISGIVRTGDADAFTSLVGAMLPVEARKTAQGGIELYYAP